MHQQPKNPKCRTGSWFRTPNYPTAPIPTTGLPPGIPYIIGNEAAERFSFYGMRAILVIFMTQYLLSPDGHASPMAESEAKFYYHVFNAGVYFFPILGALLADILWGKYATILALSLVYCLGHVALAWDETRLGLFAGLALISLGSGGIKSCVSAHVGDQFGRQNHHRLSEVFSWFYLAINLGAAGSTLLTPTLLRRYGPGLAFAVPGLLMGLATLVFFMGRARFAHIPPGRRKFIRDLTGGDGIKAVFRLIPLYLFVAMFWALFDQSGSAWVLQAERMDRRWLGWEWDSSQIQAVNPLLILVLVPAFTYGVYPICQRFFDFTPLRRIGTGLVLAGLSFSLPAVAEQMIQAGGRPGIEWQLAAYGIITSAEILVSITCLEFSYTQAPPTMKSLVMGLYLLSVSLGNVFTAVVNQAIRLTGADQPGAILAGAGYYWLFTICMLAVAASFVPVATFYRGRTYLQDETTTNPTGDDGSRQR